MNKLLSFFKNVFTFELFFFLFLYAGRYKADPRFAWVPVDLTALFFGLSVVGGIYIFIVRGFSFRPSALKLNTIYLVFVIYAFATFIWTPGEIYAREKMLYIATLTFWPLLATSLIISSDYMRIKRFLILMVLFACWMAVEAFIVYLQSGGWTLSVLGGEYLSIGRAVGPAAIIVLMYVLFFTDSLFVRVAGAVTFGFFLYIQFVTGGRGPLLAVIIPILIPIFASIKLDTFGKIRMKKSFSFLLILIGLAVVGTIYLFNSENVPVTLRRMAILVNEGGSSAQARVSFYATSLDLWAHKIFTGYGVGSWPLLVGYVDMQDYPHNIILETLVEFGLIGLIILTSLFAYGIRNLGSWRIIHNNPIRLMILMIFLNAFLNAMVTGDITDNRFLFGTLGLMMLDKKL